MSRTWTPRPGLAMPFADDAPCTGCGGTGELLGEHHARTQAGAQAIERVSAQPERGNAAFEPATAATPHVNGSRRGLLACAGAADA